MAVSPAHSRTARSSLWFRFRLVAPPTPPHGWLLVARPRSSASRFLIENQGGAGGTIALKQVIGAPADGYTLMSVGVSSTFVTQMILFNLDFDPAKLLTPVALTTIDPGALVVNAGVPVNTIDELVAYAKANPGKLNYGSSIGISPHFVVELFKRAAGVDIVHVPYRGGGPMVTDLVAGQVQMTVNGKSVLLPHIQSGKLKALAVTGDKRWPELPGVPTFVETGYLKDNYDFRVRNRRSDGHAAADHRAVEQIDQRRVEESGCAGWPREARY